MRGSAPQRLSLLSLLLCLAVAGAACSKGTLLSPGQRSAVSGIALPFVGLVRNDPTPSFPSLIFASEAIASGGCSAIAELYALSTVAGDQIGSVLASANVQADGSYRLADLSSVDRSMIGSSTSGVRYTVLVNGCGISHSRALTGYLAQDVNAASTLISYVTHVSGGKKLTEVDSKRLELLLQQIPVTALSTEQETYQWLLANPVPRAEFESLFSLPLSALRNTASRILSLNVPTSIPETSAALYAVTTNHWDPTYQATYLWKLDGANVSTSRTYSYTPTADSQGDHALALYVGKDDGAGGIDLNLPYQYKSYVVTVQNSVPPMPPNLTLSIPASSPFNIRALALALDTGIAQANCASFASLALTENSVLAPTDPALYTISCTAAVSQSVSYNLATSGDGVKVLRLWARDSAGNVSPVPASLSLMLDTAPPTVAITDIASALRGGQSATVSFASSDTGAGVSSLKLQYASDGSTFVDVATFAAGVTSSTWVVPSDNSVLAKLKLIATDEAGSTASATTSAFTIDSTPPSLPGVSLVSSATTNSTAVTLTIASCTDRAAVFVNESATAPAHDAAGWQTCSTVAGAITHTLSGEGAHAVRVWSKDTVGNVSASAAGVSVTLDTTLPAVNLTAVTGGQIVKGGAAQAITWTATDVAGAMAASPITLAYSTDSGATWTQIATSESNDGTYSWTVPSIDDAQVRVRVTGVDTAGNTATSSSTSDLTIDSTAPTLTASQMSVNGGAATTTSNYVQVSLAGADTTTKISKFCLKYNSITAPAASDACWVSVNAPLPGLVPAQTLSLANFSFLLGFGAGSYSVTAWLIDEAGNISTLSNAGAGTTAKDLASISYTPGTPPVVVNVGAYSTDAPSAPPVSSDLTIAHPGNVYIKWTASDDQALPANPVSLYYTTDDSTYTLIASNLTNAAHAGCTAGGALTGCYVWNQNVTSGYLKIRVAVQDSSSMITQATTSPLNVMPPIRFLAGNTDPGTGGSATAGMFFNDLAIEGAADSGSLAVDSNGIIYFRDVKRGILQIKPSDGIQRVLIPTTGVSSGDGGSIAGATLRFPAKIALDYQNRLLIFDYDRIRRADPAADTITTLIGGGASTADNVSPLNISIAFPGGYSNYLTTTSMPFFALPNGDIYFQSSGYYSLLTDGARIRVYKASSNTVTSIYPSGVGTAGDAARALTTCGMMHFGVTFDPLTSALTSMQIVCDVATDNVLFPNVSLNPATAVSTAPHPPLVTGGYNYVALKVQARNGELYAVSRHDGRVVRYNLGTNTWTTVVGSGTSGVCNDGTAATACNTDLQDAFVSASGQIYFMDRGRLRTVDASGNVLTIMGQGFSFGDGGTALSARFSSITAIDRTSTGDILLMDLPEKRLRKFTIGGTISALAGNGNLSAVNTTTAATGLGLQLYGGAPFFKVNPTTDEPFVFMDRIYRLDKVTGKWVIVAGGGATSYMLADGLTGGNVTLGSYTALLGHDGTNMMVAESRWNGSAVVDCFFKKYATTDGLQSHLAGFVGDSCTGISADGTTTAVSANVPNSSGLPRSIPATYDATGSRWLHASFYDTSIRILNIGGNIGTLTSLSTNIRSFVYTRQGAEEIVYYCPTSAPGLRKKNITTNTETALAWPISSLACSGYNLVYDSARSALIFPYMQNGLSGVAEYINP